MSTMVDTVTGPVAADGLGRTMMHEHFVFGYPGYSGDVTLGPYRREEALKAGIACAEKFISHGVKTVVDATPNETGRDVELLKMIAENTGLNIICSTGYYYEAEGAPAYFKFRSSLGDSEKEIYEMFMEEITRGIAGTGIKPGVIKLASSKDVITDYEAMFFRMAAKVQRETGIVIITHTQEGTMGPEQADMLIAEGADPKKTAIGHMCDNTNVDYHIKTIEKGVYISFDRMGLQGIVGAPMDNDRLEVIKELMKRGYTEKILFSHDYINFWRGRPLQLPDAVAEILANWHPGHVFENIFPQLKDAGISDNQIETTLVDNPARLFKGS